MGVIEPSSRFYQDRREFLARFHQRVWLVGKGAVMPAAVLAYLVNTVTKPCWQTFTMLAISVGLAIAWWIAARCAEKRQMGLSALLLSGSGIVYCIGALVLREGSAMSTAIALITCFVYVSLWSDTALFFSVTLSTLLFTAGLVVNYFKLIPQFGASPVSTLAQSILWVWVFFPASAYFLRASQRINQALFREGQEIAQRKLDVLEAVAKVQPELDQAIAGIRPMAESFASTASQQASTSAQMEVSAQRVAAMIGETASVAQSTQTAAERIRGDAALGRQKLREAAGALEKSVSRIESVRKQIDELADEVSQTEQVNHAIHEIAKSLTVLGFNASLEAAHAGPAGIGFGVVAKALQRMVAQTSADLSKANQILEHLRARAALIAQDADDSTNDLRASYERLASVSALLEGITDSFEGASQSFQGIAGAAEQQRTSINEISTGIRDLAEVAGQLSDAGQSLHVGLNRVEGVHGQLRGLLAAK